MEELQAKRAGVKDLIAQNSNIISCILTICVFVGVNMISTVINEDSLTALRAMEVIDWIILISKTLLTTGLGVLAKYFIKKQGVRNAFELPEVDVVYKELLDLQATDTKDKIPKDYKDVLRVDGLKQLISGIIISVMMSTLITLIGLTFDFVNAISMLLTISIWIGFGFMDYCNIYEYIKTNQIVRMKFQIKELKEAHFVDNKGPNNGSGEDSRRTGNEECVGCQ